MHMHVGSTWLIVAERLKHIMGNQIGASVRSGDKIQRAPGLFRKRSLEQRIVICVARAVWASAATLALITKGMAEFMELERLGASFMKNPLISYKLYW